MSIYRDQITGLLYEKRGLLGLYNEELIHIEGGHLICSTIHGRKYYYKSDISGTGAKVSLFDKPESIKKLARKEFLIRSISALENNIKLLEYVDKHYEDESFDALKLRMRKAFADLPDEYFLTSAMKGAAIYQAGDRYCLERHRAWAEEPYEMSSYKPERLKFPTSAGIKVRSKSEQHIVEKLVEYGVPFRYEEVLRLGGATVVPDFKFQDALFKPVYWEHAGMMNIDYYRKSHERKMKLLEANGIVPWDNLIVTYDVDDTINVPMIKSIIENELIPRL